MNDPTDPKAPKTPNETLRLAGDDVAARKHAAVHGALLVVDAKGPSATSVSLELGSTVTVGRDSRSGGCDLVVEDSSLSREHARFTCGEGLFVVDLGSTNGTRVNGILLQPHTPQPLATGDEVLLGAVVVGVHAAVKSGRRSVLVSHQRFEDFLDEELVRTRIFGRTCALVLLKAASAAAGFGATTALGTALQLLRPVDRVAAYADDVLELLFAETGADAVALASRIAASPASRVGVAVYPTHGTTVDALYGAALAGLGQPSSLAHASSSSSGSPLLIGSTVMRELSATVEKVARTLIPVLVIGETGSGKELVAREIHRRSARAAQPFVSVNCGAIPATLIESTLFGHERGAFTGADAPRAGVFEGAHGGTVFLDEAGELSTAAQTALLRVLETKRITRVGSHEELAVDVRVIAATHRDLDAMVADGTFRQDLLYRLNAMTLAVPSLRERPAEIMALARTFVDEANVRHGRDVHDFNADATEAMLGYRWPGNVRELKNAVERAVVIATHPVIDVDDLPEALQRSAGSPPRSRDDKARPAGASLSERLEKFEAKLILDALDENDQSVAATAAALGMPKRTLQYRMKLLGISRKPAYARGGVPE